ncbi:MAG: hypothetical protein LH478_04740 [Chitinophagaceae bacterium]|nr:hypothetical protein [Chitinophagaceae bacterium]
MNINREILDHELIALLQKIEKAAFEFLYDKYAPMLYGIICKLVEDNWLADEILKKSFVQIWHQLASIQHSRCKLFILMHNITRNIAMEELNKTINMHNDKEENYRYKKASVASFGAIMLS